MCRGPASFSIYLSRVIRQFCGDDPNVLLEAARYVEPHVDAVDLNLGCPQVSRQAGREGGGCMRSLV